MESWLLAQADALLARQPAGAALVLLDESVVEKPESRVAEGLCRVRSSRARRLARPRRGFGSGPPPARPITVPGVHWLAATVTGMSGASLVVGWRWWSPTAPSAPSAPDQSPALGASQTIEEARLARDLCQRWGGQVIFVADRGFARRPFLQLLADLHARWIIRWPKRYRLADRPDPAVPALGAQPPRPATNAWRLTASKKPWGHQTVWDPAQREWLTLAFFAVPVWLPEEAEPLTATQEQPTPAAPLWLVVSRGRRGSEPWRLLTNEPIRTAADARRIVQCYARRWQVEWAFRFGKSGLGAESVRLRRWEHRRKLLGLLALAYAFLVQLLTTAPDWVGRLLRLGCHRTGRHRQALAVPLYRLQAAVASLLALALPPPIAVPPAT